MAEPTTTVHCPDCGAEVAASASATAVACPKCSSAFSPWGLPTAPPTPAHPSRSVSIAPDAPFPHGGQEDLSGSALGGRKLVRVIGRGGMGTVYEAEDGRRGRVAVKVLPPHLAGDPQFVARFHREAQVLSGLSHPHLVEVFERGQDGTRCYFVMEHVHGESLRRVMERGPMPWRDALRVAREVLAGLGYAHGRGVVHRDLKPENVLLDAENRARLVDFGLSRIVRGEAAEDLSRLTRTNVILGTYEYMAPEQRLGKPVDERADLYALGVMLYEMLSGSLPLGRFEAASVLRPGVPSALDPVIHRALAPKAEGRFPSAVAFREALDAAERAGIASVGAGSRPAGTPPPIPYAAPGNAPTAPTEPWDPLSDPRYAALRRHVDVLAALDKVVGIIAIIAFFGFASLAAALTFPTQGISLPVFGGGSIVCLVAGILMLKLGRRLQAFDPGAREGQIAASILLLFFAPLGTALGIYGLVTLSSATARDAFSRRPRRVPPVASRGLGAWHDRPPTPAAAAIAAPASASNPGRKHFFDLVGYGLVVWAVSVLVATGIFSAASGRLGSAEWFPHEIFAMASVCGLVFTALWFLIGWRRAVVVALAGIAVWTLVSVRTGPRSWPSPYRVGWAAPAPVRVMRGGSDVISVSSRRAPRAPAAPSSRRSAPVLEPVGLRATRLDDREMVFPGLR